MANISQIKLPDNSTYNIKDNNAARGNAGIFYGTCATAAGTATKAVTCTEFTASDLKPGAVINVYFSVTNSAAVANLQLDVNGTGAKPIKYIYNGSYSNIPGVGYIKLNQIYQFTYDGTNWVIQMMYNTDANTKNTAGSTDTSSKIFLIGATSQAANPQTYSHDTAYVGTDGLLYSGSKKVATVDDISAVFKFKGTKEAVANLPSSGNVTGDVWHVTANDSEYVWTGSEWEELGVTVSIPSATQNATTGISIANHGTSSVTGVQSTTTSVRGVKTGTNSTTTASKVSFGTAFSVPNPSFSDVTIPIRADADVTVPKAASSATTVPIKAASATTVPIKNVSTTPIPVVSSNAEATLSFDMDTTDTKKLKISWSATPTRTVFGTPAEIYGVQASTTSVTGVQSSTTSVTGVNGSTTVRGVKTGTNSTTTASKATLGTAFSIPNPSTTDVTVPIRADADTTVPIKATSATTVVTGATHTITDNGHTHTI